MDEGEQNPAVSQDSPSPPLLCLLVGTSGLCLELPLRRLFHISASHLGLKAREQPLHLDPRVVPDTLQRPPWFVPLKADFRTKPPGESPSSRGTASSYWPSLGKEAAPALCSSYQENSVWVYARQRGISPNTCLISAHKSL